MSILTEEEIEKCVVWNGPKNNPFFNRIEFAQNVADKVVEKLSGTYIPEIPINKSPSCELGWHECSMKCGSPHVCCDHYLSPEEYEPSFSIDEMKEYARQAFAQGAASQLSAEPVGTVSAGTFVHWKDEAVPLMGASLYTLKEPK